MYRWMRVCAARAMSCIVVALCVYIYPPIYSIYVQTYLCILFFHARHTE